jgi:hypothetical protein
MCGPIPWQEWDFDRCPESERGFCYPYEPIRERVLRIKDPTSRKWHNYVEDLRLKVGLDGPPTPDVCARIRLEVTGASFWRVLGGFPEWPAKPYLTIARDERVRRLELLMPEFYPRKSPASDIIPERLPKGYEEVVNAMIAAGILPILKSDIASMLDVELETQKTNSQNCESREILATVDGSIVPIKIPYNQGKEWFLRHAGDLWEQAVPEEHKRKIHGGSRGTEPSRNLPALRKLGAYRLVRVWKLSIPDAIKLTATDRHNHLGKKLGALYLNERSWFAAVKDAVADFERF